jgi:phosphatidate cytidylyltransferase
LLQRILTGTVAVTLLLSIVAVDIYLAGRHWGPEAFESLIRRGSLIPLFFAGVMALAVLELTHILRAAGQRPDLRWCLATCCLLVLSPWLCAGGVLGDGILDLEAVHFQTVWLIAALIGAVMLQVFRGMSPTAIPDLASTWFVILYLGFLPSFAVLLRSNADLADASEGAWVVFCILMVAFVSDIGALFVGMAIGRRKLAPTISPAKSVEGFVGGVLASVLVAVAIRAIALATKDAVVAESDAMARFVAVAADATQTFGRLTLFQVIVFGAVMSFFTQIGDLFESLCKRSAQVKDSSAVIPGMGGVLDVIDGVILALPVAWYLLTRAWQVV